MKPVAVVISPTSAPSRELMSLFLQAVAQGGIAVIPANAEADTTVPKTPDRLQMVLQMTGDNEEQRSQVAGLLGLQSFVPEQPLSAYQHLKCGC